MKKHKILVTGGTGYIGSHTSVELIQAGYELVIIDNLSNSSEKVLSGIESITGTKPEFIQLDMRDEALMKQVFESHPDISACIHFAALKAVGESHEKPLEYYDNNLKSLLNLLKFFPEHHPVKIVFSSSCTVYGNPDELPVSEQSPIKPAMSPYGNTKRIAEEILQDYVSSTKAACIALRYFNPIGAHPSGIIGELPQGVPNNLMPFITQTALGVRETLQIFGKDYDTPDGTCVRDYIDVLDLAKAHVIALERILNKNQETNYEFFNLGTGKGVSVLEMVNHFQDVTAQKLNYKFAPRRAGDVPSVYADTTKANQILGWKAEKSIAETIANAWKWEMNYRKQENHEK
ncbi:MAG: UDP-glucose 4-epimerase GalE [Bacteroidales bacterium]|jgi:UDP-glucose 4-epimerase|nr:UDP-glucose 4-epimerase GalE [Bacteroidales bacterium]